MVKKLKNLIIKIKYMLMIFYKKVRNNHQVKQKIIFMILKIDLEIQKINLINLIINKEIKLVKKM